MKQADALYHLGDFEHALVFYHRGLRWVHTPGDQVTRWVQGTQVGPGGQVCAWWKIIYHFKRFNRLYVDLIANQ